jgi:hypothetical protein
MSLSIAACAASSRASRNSHGLSAVGISVVNGVEMGHRRSASPAPRRSKIRPATKAAASASIVGVTCE